VRLPFPERIPIDRVAIFAAVLFVIQQFEGTELYFSAGCVAFILISTLAFNTVGGLTRASGAYIFFYSTLVVIIGICYKAFLGEPAQSNLLDPRGDIEVYVAGITGMYLAALISRRLVRKTGLLQDLMRDSEMYRSSVGCIAFGIMGATAIALLGQTGVQLETAFLQLNQLIPLGMIIAAGYEIRRSGGTRSVNMPLAVGGLYFFIFFGIIGFSKQGLFSPLFCWLVPICALRYRLSNLQISGGLLAIFIMFHYLAPYSQYGRTLVEPGMTPSQRLDISVRLLEHPEKTRETYFESAQQMRGLDAYYNTDQGFWDRLQFISADDALNNITDQGSVFGLRPLQYALYNAVPHIIWPNKPTLNAGYTYAHEITGEAIDPDDPGIGIAFSPTAEAYHMDQWRGVLLIAPLTWLLFFVVFDSLLGDLRTTPWGLLALVMISHSAPEGGLTGVIYLLSFGIEILLFCALFAKWAAPFVALAVLGPVRKPLSNPVTAIHSRAS
jgi:hypothetical protein